MRFTHDSGWLTRSRTWLGQQRCNLQAALLVARGRRLAAAGQHDAAFDLYRQAFDLDPLTPLSVYETLPVAPGAMDEHIRQAEHLFRQGREAEADRRYAQAIASAGNYRESRDLDRLLEQVVMDDTVVITQFAINYFPMFEIWYRHFRRCSNRQVLVIALDPVAYRKVRDMGLCAYLLPVFNFQAGIRSVLWSETVKFRKQLIDRGVHYLHSDIDALWLADPLPAVLAQPGDVVASIGFGTPVYVVNDWGFVLCLGFYLMRSTAATRKLYPAYVDYTQRWGHDQNGLNTLLWERGTVWQGTDAGLWHGHCERLDLQLTVLPEALVSRQTDSRPRPLVVHPLLEVKGMGGKLRLLAEAGLA